MTVWEINGTQINPRNMGDIGYRAEFGNKIDEFELTVDNISLTREDYANIIIPHIQQRGVFEGIPVTATVVSNTPGVQNVSIQYYIDLQDKPKFKTYDVEVSIKKRYGSDRFWNAANGQSFEMVNKTNSLPVFDVPYVIIKDNQAQTAISIAITLYLMVKEAISATQQLISDIVDLIGAVTPNVGFGVNFDIGDIISKVIKVIAQLAYLAILVVAIINLSKQLFELIFPKVRYFKGCKVKDLLKNGIESLGLGLTFKSTLLDALPGLTILPKPLKKQTKKWFEFTQNSLDLAFNKGYPTASDTTPTVGALLEAIREQFNGRVRIIGNTVFLERRDYWSTITQNSLMPALALQDKASDEYTFNSYEAYKRCYLHYQTDISDLFTFDNFEGVDCEFSSEAVSIVNADLFIIKGLKEVNIPFALGARKTKLNWLEELSKALFKQIDKVINTLGGSSSLMAKIENRIGVLMISQQYFNTTKMLYTVGGKQPANYLSIIQALSIYNNYHVIDQIENNGYKIRENVPVAVNPSDFVSLLNNNYAEIDGVVMEISSFEYVEDAKEMTITYREPYNYAAGKVKTVLING